MPQDPLRDHLVYFQELGVDGMHPDAAWRARPVGRGFSPTDANVRRGEPSGSPDQEPAVIPVSEVRDSSGDTLAIIKADSNGASGS